MTKWTRTDINSLFKPQTRSRLGHTDAEIDTVPLPLGRLYATYPSYLIDRTTETTVE